MAVTGRSTAEDLAVAAAAAALADRRNQAALAERIEQQEKAQAEADRLEALERRLGVVETHQGTILNQDELLQLNVSIQAVLKNLLEQATLVESQQAAVAEMLARVDDTLQQVADGAESKSQAIAVVKSMQQMLNGLQRDFGRQIQDREAQRAAEQQHVSDLMELVQVDARTVRQAAAITDEARNIAKTAATAEVDSMWDSFVASMNVTLRAAGVTRSQFLQILNSGMVQGDQAVVASREELAAYVAMSRKFVEAQAEADRQTDLASRRATDLLQIPGGGGTVG